METKRNLASVWGWELEILTRYFRAHLAQKVNYRKRAWLRRLVNGSLRRCLLSAPFQIWILSPPFLPNNLPLSTPWGWGTHSSSKQPSIANLLGQNLLFLFESWHILPIISAPWSWLFETSPSWPPPSIIVGGTRIGVRKRALDLESETLVWSPGSWGSFECYWTSFTSSDSQNDPLCTSKLHLCRSSNCNKRETRFR